MEVVLRCLEVDVLKSQNSLWQFVKVVKQQRVAGASDVLWVTVVRIAVAAGNNW